MAPARHGIDPAQDGTPRTNPKEDGPGLEEKFRRSVAKEVVKDVVEDTAKKECRANWLEEQGQLNASNLFKWWSGFATGVTGETNVVKGQARDTEAEPDRQHEEAQTKARRKGAEKAQKRARVNTPANAISPPPLPPRRLQRTVAERAAATTLTAIWQRESTAGKAQMAKHCWLSTDGKALLAEGVAV